MKNTGLIEKSPSPVANFSFGFLGASLGTACCHPFDVVRVRSMVTGSTLSSFNELLKNTKTQGITSLWVGLSAGLLRQAFYGTARFGAFETLQDWLKQVYKKSKLSPLENASCGLAAGALAGFVGNPPDVALTRMTSDLKLPPELRRNYRNGFEAMIRIAKEEGVISGLLCGVSANIQRSVVVNGVMLGTYAQSKDFFQSWTNLPKNSPILQFLAGNVAGFMTGVFAVPADLIKTKLQHAQPGEYLGARDLIFSVLRTKGIRGFWAGFLPFWFKLAPHTTISFMVIENLREIWMNT